MGEFVPQRAVDFGIAERAEARVEMDEGFTGVGGAGGAAHAWVPAHADAGGEVGAAEGAEEKAGGFLQIGRVAFRRCDDRRRALGLDRGAEAGGELAEKIELHDDQ